MQHESHENYRFWSENQKETNHLKDLGVYGRIILNASEGVIKILGSNRD
jgi:hypothetical protein